MKNFYVAITEIYPIFFNVFSRMTICYRKLVVNEAPFARCRCYCESEKKKLIAIKPSRFCDCVLTIYEISSSRSFSPLTFSLWRMLGMKETFWDKHWAFALAQFPFSCKLSSEWNKSKKKKKLSSQEKKDFLLFWLRKLFVKFSIDRPSNLYQ